MDGPEAGPVLEHIYWEYSHYSVALPAGSFTVWFEEENDPGVIVYPKFVTHFFEVEPKCSTFVTPDSITILKPPAQDSRCDDLIHNGDFTTDTAGWQGTNVIQFFYNSNAGIDGTGALVGESSSNTPVHQWLDMSCFVENGGKYMLQASYRIIDQIDNLGRTQDLPTRRNNLLSQITFIGSNGDSASYLELTQPPNTQDQSGFHVLSGSFTVTPEQAAGVKARIQIMFFGANFILDNVSLVKADTTILV